MCGLASSSDFAWRLRLAAAVKAAAVVAAAAARPQIRHPRPKVCRKRTYRWWWRPRRLRRNPTPWPSRSLTAWDAFSAVYVGPSAPATAPGNFGAAIPTADLAVALARTGAFFSNDQAPLSSRTVRFISGIHFPPGVENTASAALYGIENTNRGCNLAASIDAIVPPATTIAGASPGYGVITGKADLNDSDATAVNPGGVPIFKNGQEVGGVGVVAADPDTAEYVAFAAAGMIAMSGPSAATDGVGFPTFPAPGIVSINGITLPFVNQTTPPSGVTSGTFNAANFTVGPVASPGVPPEGALIAATNGPVGGLTAARGDADHQQRGGDGQSDARADSTTDRRARKNDDRGERS